jgi:hypothetical protein
MEFEPKSENELWEETLLPTGEYDFDVVSAEAKQSKAGNDMIALKLRVYPNDGGSPRTVKDWLMAQMGFKLRHFCYATGLDASYDNGTLTDIDCNGVAGRLKLGIQESAEFGKQNSVKDYVVPSMASDELPNEDPPPPPPKKQKPVGVSTSQTQAANAAAADDDIPF